MRAASHSLWVQHRYVECRKMESFRAWATTNCFHEIYLHTYMRYIMSLYSSSPKNHRTYQNVHAISAHNKIIATLHVPNLNGIRCVQKLFEEVIVALRFSVNLISWLQNAKILNTFVILRRSSGFHQQQLASAISYLNLTLQKKY